MAGKARKTEPAGVAVIPDDIADAWIAAKAAHDKSRQAVRTAENRLRAYIGEAGIGAREDGTVVCVRVLSTTAGKYVPVHHRDDLRMAGKGDRNGD
jgi:hypothetical protein